MKPTSKGLRDLFFLAAGAAVLYNQVWQREDISPLGAFLVLFLWGLVPAFRADEGATSGPLAILLHILGALGGKAPPASQVPPEGRAAPADPAGREDRAAAPEGRAAPGDAAEPPPATSPPESKGPG